MGKKNVCRLVAALLIACVAFTIAGCGATSKESKLDQVKKAGKLVVGTSADYPPYEFHKKIDGKDKVVGFDMDIANEIAKDLGVTLEIKDMDFKALLGALQAGKVDMVMAGMTPDEKRKKSVDFSKIYFGAEQGIIVRTEDKDKFKTIDDFKNVRVTTQQGSIQEDIAKTQMAGAQLKTLAKIGDVVLDLKAKKCDAIIMELPVAKMYITENPELVISDVKVKDDAGGSAVAVKKGETDFVKSIDSTIDRLMDSGKIDEFVANGVKLSQQE